MAEREQSKFKEYGAEAMVAGGIITLFTPFGLFIVFGGAVAYFAGDKLANKR